MVIPWKTVPAQLFFSNSLKLSGQPFFNISLAWIPLICITALECEIFVILKFSLLHCSLIVLSIFSFLEITNHVLGALQRILVSLFDETFEFCKGNSKPSICILFNWIFDFLYWTIWIIVNSFNSEIFNKSLSFFFYDLQKYLFCE